MTYIVFSIRLNHATSLIFPASRSPSLCHISTFISISIPIPDHRQFQIIYTSKSLLSTICIQPQITSNFNCIHLLTTSFASPWTVLWPPVCVSLHCSATIFLHASFKSSSDESSTTSFVYRCYCCHLNWKIVEAAPSKATMAYSIFVEVEIQHLCGCFICYNVLFLILFSVLLNLLQIRTLYVCYDVREGLISKVLYFGQGVYGGYY